MIGWGGDDVRKNFSFGSPPLPLWSFVRRVRTLAKSASAAAGRRFSSPAASSRAQSKSHWAASRRIIETGRRLTQP